MFCVTKMNIPHLQVVALAVPFIFLLSGKIAQKYQIEVSYWIFIPVLLYSHFFDFKFQWSLLTGFLLTLLFWVIENKVNPNVLFTLGVTILYYFTTTPHENIIHYLVLTVCVSELLPLLKPYREAIFVTASVVFFLKSTSKMEWYILPIMGYTPLIFHEEQVVFQYIPQEKKLLTQEAAPVEEDDADEVL